jgi:recombination protein RecA
MFAPDTASETTGNLIFGLWESDGWVSCERTGAVRCGFATTSPQLAQQLHWQLLRWGITSSIKVGNHEGRSQGYAKGREIFSRRDIYQVRIGGVDNQLRFAEVVPMWGPKGRKLTNALRVSRLHRCSQSGYLPRSTTAPVLSHLRERGLTVNDVASLVHARMAAPGEALKQVLGSPRLRRDRVQRLSDAIESQFLWELLDQDVWFEKVYAIHDPQPVRMYEIGVEALDALVAGGLVVSGSA